MKNLILSVLISTALFANIANAETYFECTDTDNNHISLKDNGDLVRYHFKNSDGETYFDMQKDSIVAQAGSFGNNEGQDATFYGDNASYYLFYTKFANGKKIAYMQTTLTDENGDTDHFHRCDVNKPMTHALDKLN